jgi:signal transduction histidine kinase
MDEKNGITNQNTAIEQSTKNVILSEQLLKSVVETAPFPIGVYIGKEMRVQLANQSMIETWGKGADVIGKLYAELLPELEGQNIYRQLDDVFTTGVAFHATNQRVNLFIDGKPRTYYFNYSFTPLFNNNGEVYGVMNTGANVTELNLANQKIIESEENLRNIILQAPVAMSILKGPEHVVEIANERMYELWGKTKEALLGKPIFEGLPEVKGQGFEDLLSSVYNTGQTVKGGSVPVTLPRIGGVEIVYANFVYEAYREANGKIGGVMVVATDVTAQELSKRKVQESEDRLLIALNAAELGTFEVNYAALDKMVTNSQFYKIFGFDAPAERNEYSALIHPEDMPIRDKAIAESFSTGKLFYEIRLLLNHKVRWIRVVGKVLFNSQGISEKLLGIVQDITKEKDLQLQKDNFIAMASHELKTPVTSIKAYTQILEQMLLQKGEVKEAGMINRMDTQINRLTNLISDLLNLTKINTGKFEYHETYFDFNELVRQMAEELQPTSAKHTLTLALDNTVTIFADRERIGQVITNFISNAIKYSPDADTVNISTTAQDDTIRFCVQDFGIGINAESIDKVFDQFYRVNNEKHQSFQGMGLGLYISSEIIKNEGGKIWVESVEGEGSKFYFSLPVKKLT